MMFVMRSMSSSTKPSYVRWTRSTVYITAVAGMMDWIVRRIRFSISGLDSFEENEVACAFLRSSFSVKAVYFRQHFLC